MTSEDSVSVPNITIRQATLEDVDALSEVEILARPSDPSWTYRYPYREEYPDDHRAFNRAKYEVFFRPNARFEVVLAEAPSHSDPAVKVPVGVSIWQVDKAPWFTLPQDTSGSSGLGAQMEGKKRRDEHPGRVKAMYRVHDAAKDFFFGPALNVDRHAYLAILAVHPEYQRLGVGARLCRWGIEKARQYPGCKVGVMASQLDSSRRLYDGRLGFRSIGATVARDEDDEEGLELRTEILLWEPDKTK